MSLIDAFQQPNNALIRALRELLDASTKEEAKAVLERNKALLLTDVAINLLSEFRDAVMQDDPTECMYDPSYIMYHHILLADACLYGIPKGWETADAMISRFHKSREELKHSTRDLLRGWNKQ